MKTDKSQLNDPYEFVKHSSLYQEFLAERDEILRHKWLESERLGQDIGIDRAMFNWFRKHRACWRASRRNEVTDDEQSIHLSFCVIAQRSNENTSLPLLTGSQ